MSFTSSSSKFSRKALNDIAAPSDHSARPWVPPRPATPYPDPPPLSKEHSPFPLKRRLDTDDLEDEVSSDEETAPAHKRQRLLGVTTYIPPVQVKEEPVELSIPADSVKQEPVDAPLPTYEHVKEEPIDAIVPTYNNGQQEPVHAPFLVHVQPQVILHPYMFVPLLPGESRVIRRVRVEWEKAVKYEEDSDTEDERPIKPLPRRAEHVGVKKEETDSGPGSLAFSGPSSGDSVPTKHEAPARRLVSYESSDDESDEDAGHLLPRGSRSIIPYDLEEIERQRVMFPLSAEEQAHDAEAHADLYEHNSSVHGSYRGSSPYLMDEWGLLGWSPSPSPNQEASEEESEEESEEGSSKYDRLEFSSPDLNDEYGNLGWDPLLMVSARPSSRVQ